MINVMGEKKKEDQKKPTNQTKNEDLDKEKRGSGD